MEMGGEGGPNAGLSMGGLRSVCREKLTLGLLSAVLQHQRGYATRAG